MKRLVRNRIPVEGTFRVSRHLGHLYDELSDELLPKPNKWARPERQPHFWQRVSSSPNVQPQRRQSINRPPTPAVIIYTPQNEKGWRNPSRFPPKFPQKTAFLTTPEGARAIRFPIRSRISQLGAGGYSVDSTVSPETVMAHGAKMAFTNTCASCLKRASD